MVHSRFSILHSSGAVWFNPIRVVPPPAPRLPGRREITGGRWFARGSSRFYLDSLLAIALHGAGGVLVRGAAPIPLTLSSVSWYNRAQNPRSPCDALLKPSQGAAWSRWPWGGDPDLFLVETTLNVQRNVRGNWTKRPTVPGQVDAPTQRLPRMVVELKFRTDRETRFRQPRARNCRNAIRRQSLESWTTPRCQPYHLRARSARARRFASRREGQNSQ
eukprot:gene11522-biopygen19892